MSSTYVWSTDKYDLDSKAPYRLTLTDTSNLRISRNDGSILWQTNLNTGRPICVVNIDKKKF